MQQQKLIIHHYALGFNGGKKAGKDCFCLLLVFISIKYFQMCAFVSFVSSTN